MKKRITIAFSLIFALFALGTGVMLFNLIRTTADLKYLVGLHEIEDIRQDLFNSVQRVSSFIYGSEPVFADHLDDIIRSTDRMHSAIRRCDGCHHQPAVEAELMETVQMVDAFEEQLSFLVTLTADFKRRHQKQEEVYQAASNILNRVQGMVNRAAATIDSRTRQVMGKLEWSYWLIGATLAASSFLALIVANFLAREITRPIDALVASTRKIADGDWGHQNHFSAGNEFGELIDSFNRMSSALAEQRDQQQRNLLELRRTQQKLIETEKLTALGTLAGGIAHDFNNILCGMIGHLHILGREIPPNEAHRQTIATIEQAGFRAADLVKQLLTFARQKPMILAPVDLDRSLDRILRQLQQTIGQDIRITLHTEPPLPQVTGDADQLEQALLNLCLNSRDAMPEGGTISIDAREVALDEEFCRQHPEARPGEYFLLTVQDTGTGINEKILPRVFDPFFTTKVVGKGSGLGLAMVYGIIKNHDGFCLIESTPGQGTTVRIYLPATTLRKQEETLPASEPVSLEGRTILIVDDEEMVTSMLADYLQEKGCRTLVARNGLEGVEIYEKNRKEIDLVILDIIMPVMNGREAFERMLRIDPRVRVLVSSGYIMNSETQEILNLGARGFLQKPYNLDRVSGAISDILRT